MSNPLLEALGVVGDVLDTPGSVVRGLLSGNAGRAFGGILDPSQRVHGREMLDQWGWTDENSGLGGDIAGIGASLATDPLNLLGGWGLLKGAKYLRGGRTGAGATEAATAGRAAEEVSPLLRTMEGAEAVVPRAAEEVVATKAVSPLTEAMGPALSRTEAGLTDSRLSRMTTMPEVVPEVVPGRAGPMTRVLDSAVEAEAANPMGFRDVMAMRRQTPVAKITDPSGRWPAHESYAGPSPAKSSVLQGAKDMQRYGANGVFYGKHHPEGPMVAVMANERLPQTLRHELSHALTSSAPSGTAREALNKGIFPQHKGLLTSAGYAQEQQGSNAARMLDEVLARAAEDSVLIGDTAGGLQKQNALAFLNDPNHAGQYLKDFRLLGTPYESFFMQELPRILEQTQGAGLLDYLRPMAQRSRELGLSVGAPLGGSALLAALMGQEQQV